MTNLLGLEHLGQPFSQEDKAGPDLEYDSDFIQLGTMITPAKAGMVAAGDDDDDDGIDWKAAKVLALGLAEKTRDLRLVSRLGRCLVETDGLEGLAAAIGVLKTLIADLWDEVHPVLDADDDMDVTMRLNALGILTAPDLVLALDKVPLAKTKVGMAANLRNIEISIGKIPAESEDERSMSSGVVAAAFVEDVPADILARKNSVDQCLADIEAIQTSWLAHTEALAAAREAEGLRFEPGHPPQFEALEKKLQAISKHIGERLPEEVREADSAGAENGAINGSGIVTRADAGREIDKIIQWFQKNEPSSPVPIMLARAKSMISMTFLEIVEGLGDSGLNEVRKGSGRLSGEGEE